MALSISRRTLGKSLLAAPFFSSSAAADDPPAYAGAIDMHCHFVNASDAPTEEFIRHTVLDAIEGELLEAPKKLAAFVAGLIVSGAPSAEKELERMKGGSPLAVAERDALFEQHLAEQIGALLSEYESVGGLDHETRRLLAMVSQVSAMSDENSVALEETAGRSPALLAKAIANRVAEFDAGEWAEGFWNRLPIVGDTLAAFSWAKMMLGWRLDILARYERTYGGPDGVTLATPALLDFSYWLTQDGNQTSSLESQVEFLSQLSKRPDGVVLHGFAPFDPLRAVFQSDSDPFTLIEQAIHEMGFVGVKIYPAMGFYPKDNAEKEGIDFARDILRDLETSAALANEIDKTLNRLYEWVTAQENQVPILAHARESYGGRPGYEIRGRPDGWEAVLDAHSDIKVALAHFGDFERCKLCDDEDWIVGEVNWRWALIYDPERKRVIFEGEDDRIHWENDVAKILDECPDAGLYADLSFLVAAMGGRKSKNDWKARKLGAFTPENRSRRLLFGTDYDLIGFVRGHKNYLSGFDRHLEMAGFTKRARKRIFRDNAIDYLGLQRGSKNMERLERFYERNTLDFNRLLKALGTPAPT